MKLQVSGAILVIALILNGAVAQERWLNQAAVAHWAKGNYSYRKLSSGEEKGAEDFLLVVGRDGARTLRATNAFIDGMEIWRHVVYRVGRDFRPLDLYLNYTTDGQWRGSGFFTVDGKTLHARLNNTNGLVETRIELPDEFSLIPHPIASNGWFSWYYDHAKRGEQPVSYVALL